ncbi:nitroreductase family deazaflavin-dependent oxidoreductase [Sciscionella sediminilitoris]|uniref:nitroreductase family deazaflavin-dependent oxidoreductase n=1 Tax=Sciscionella sediminilitoris TaxID=1445613 RepID=UPI000562F29A|nr:nitroreductase family deazaflavin-dependent oxidoreductase [Sciscionella sp. SE31]
MATTRMSKTRPPRLMRLLQVLGSLYDHEFGWLLGQRFLRLSHTGRRSGRCYRVMLEVIGIDREAGEIYVLAGLGPKTDWYRNVLAAPARIDLGAARLEVRAHPVDPVRAAGILNRYEYRNRMLAPIVRRGLSWVIGWRYDGSEAARHRLLAECPVVAFRPGRA